MNENSKANLAEGMTQSVHGATGRTATVLQGDVVISRSLANRVWGLLAQECSPCASEECQITRNPAAAIDGCCAELKLALAASPSAPADKAEPVAWIDRHQHPWSKDLGFVSDLRWTRDEVEGEGAPLFAAPPTSLLREVMEAPIAVRMPSEKELAELLAMWPAVELTSQIGTWSPEPVMTKRGMEICEKIIRKCAEDWGLTIKEDKHG